MAIGLMRVSVAPKGMGLNDFVPESAAQDEVRGYLRGLDRPEQALQADLPRYLDLWKVCVPAEFEHLRQWDFSRFTRGERFVYRPVERSEFDDVLVQVRRWGLGEYLKETSFDRLAYRAPA